MEKQNSLAIPVAIVVAGVIVAGSIYFSRGAAPGGQTAQVAGANATTAQVSDFTIPAVSNKDFIRGNTDAKVVVVEYSDTECPFCKRFHATMKSFADKFSKDGTAAWVYRTFPLEQLHPKAPKESEALLCANKLGGQAAFWSYTDQIYAVTPSNNGLDAAQLPQIAKSIGLDVTAFNTCLSSGEMAATVKTNIDDAVKAGGNGTPFSIFVAKKPFNQTKVQAFLTGQIVKNNYPVDLFVISKDNTRVSVSGAMPSDFMDGLVGVMIQ